MNKQLLTLCGAALLVGTASAQELKSGYVTFPNPQKLKDYVTAWNGGAGNISIDGATWEDEEFFTSRVKPRTRVSATAVNIRDLGDKAGRRMLYWVPLGNSDFQGLPNGKFDSEAFSTWSYLDHFGSFTSPYGWVAGAFADAAHKNGVAVTGVASVPQSIPAEWTSALQTMGSTFGPTGKAEPLGKFLLYHGCDGLTYNSEWSGLSPTSSGLLSMHEQLYSYMAGKNPVFENIWYDGTTDTGGCSFDSALEGKTGIYKASSIFSNYNWNSTSKLSNAVTRANGVTGVDGSIRGPWWNYAGCNYEGGEPAGTNYTYLPSYQWSVGYWGAHSVNMIWANRNGGGSSAEACQLYYQHQHEKFFGNGKRNPAIDMSIINIKSHRPSDTFHGASKYIAERSALTHVTKNEPFYTFFNLGNGKFFNWKGDRMNDKEWYSLGIQDYMPTWRWWFAPNWLQKSVSDSEVAGKLTADFTYEDAYVGGSCLKIEGSATQEYLHLFKTEMEIASGSKITVRYKLLNGSGDVRLVLASATNPSTMPADKTNNLYLFTTANSAEVQDASYEEGADGWVTAEWTSASNWFNASNMPGGLGVIGLEFKNAKNLELLLGEISIMPRSNTTTPVAPQIKSTKVLNNNYKGVDAKIIWTMDGDAARKAGTPKYNSDVNASMYKVWSQEEGGTEQFLGMTTSWAAIAFQAPNTDSSKKIRFGVSAVAADTRSESAIAWSDYYTKGEYAASDEVTIDKRTIKVNEGFTISYADPRHSNSNWALYNTAGTKVASASNSTSFSVPSGMSTEGGYDLVVDEGTANERRFGYFVQVSGEAVGAMPRVDDLFINNESAGNANIQIKVTDQPVLSYTGRKSDGQASRADALSGHTIGAEVSDLGIAATSNTSFTIVGWYKFNEIPQHTGGWAFINAADKMNATWPKNEWGWCWNSGDSDGAIELVFRGHSSDSSSPGELHYTYPDLRLQAGSWYHIALVHEYNGTQFRALLYVNGVKQNGKVFQYASGNICSSGGRSITGTTLGWTCSTCGTNNCSNGNHKSNTTWHGTNSDETWIPGMSFPLPASSQVYFGGPKYQGATIDGLVDDFMVWNGAMTAAQVKESMNGYSGTLPSNIIALWDFETDANSENYIMSKGSKTVALKTYDVTGGESDRKCEYFAPAFESGCPFLTGTAFPIVTTATWKDAADRKTVFEKQAVASRAAVTEGEAGSAKVTFRKGGDHELSITLANDYGSSSKSFPIYEVDAEVTGIEGVEADGGLKTYTIDRTFFLEFGEDGDYQIDIYNMAGMLAASKGVSVMAGQTAQIDLGQSGVYLVKVVKNGKVLRTLKILAKA